MIKLSKRRNRKFKPMAACSQCDGKYKVGNALMYYVVEPACNIQIESPLPSKLKTKKTTIFSKKG